MDIKKSDNHILKVNILENRYVTDGIFGQLMKPFLIPIQNFL